MSIMHLNEENFDKEVLESGKPVLVDFFATWCGPCKMLAPVLEEIAAENPDFSIGKVDVDESTNLAGRYGVMSVPTLIFFKGGEIHKKMVGAAQAAPFCSQRQKIFTES